MSSHVVNKKPLPSAFPNLLSPYQVFTRLVCCFTIKLYQPSFALVRLLPKITHFQSKKIFFFQLIVGRFWFCCFAYMCLLRCSFFFTVLLSWNYESTISRLHGFWFGLSSNHMTKQKKSWFENYKLLFFFLFPRKLNLRLILPP